MLISDETMDQEAEVKVGKKFAVSIPKALAERLDLGEGGRVSFQFEEGKLILVPVRRRARIKDAVELAVRGKKFASLSFKEVEKVSMEEQSRYENPP